MCDVTYARIFEESDVTHDVSDVTHYQMLLSNNCFCAKMNINFVKLWEKNALISDFDCLMIKLIHGS